MKLKYKILILIMAITLGLLLFFYLSPKNLKQAIFQEFQPFKKEKTGISWPQNFTQTSTTVIQANISESNYSAILPQESKAGIVEEKEAAKAITLEIVDICSGKLDLFAVSEGITKCLNKKYPYQIILEKNSTHLTTRFYGIEGFEESYDLNETITIFYIFAEDVASVSHEIQSFSLEGDPNFGLGQYHLFTIWEKDASGNLTISKMIVALPLQVNGNISASEEWKELKFYLNTPNKTYYLGNISFLVKK